MALPKKSENYISLKEATKLCEHSQEYLSLRARQGKLKAIKFGRNWVTKKEWIQEYLSGIESYENNLNGKKKVKREEKKPDARLANPPKNLPIGNFQLSPVSPLSFRASEFLKKELIKAIASPAIRTGFAIVLVFVLLTTGLILGKASLHQASKEAGLYETINVFSEYGQWVKNNIEKVPGVKEFTEQINRETKIVQRERKENLSLVVSAFEKINSGVVNAWNKITSPFQRTAKYVFRTLIEGWLDIKDAYLAVRDLININISLGNQKIDQWAQNFFEGLGFITYPWGSDRSTRLVINQSELDVLKQEIETLRKEGIIAKELIKEIEVSKITKIEEIEQTIKQYVQIDDVELAMFKSQLEDLDSWKTGIASKLQLYPGNTNIPTAPIYISSPGGIQVGGHGSFVSLGVQGSATIDTLGVRGAVYLGTNPELASDMLTVGMTSTFLQTATFEQGIAPNLGIGDASADYPLEVLAISTQFAITNTDETAYAEFYVDGDGDLTISSSGQDISLENNNLITTGTITGTNLTATGKVTTAQLQVTTSPTAGYVFIIRRFR